MAYTMNMWNYGTTTAQKTGKLGEDLAVKWLLDRGHDVVDRNIRTNHGEIDVVTMSGGVTHFIEVKSAVCTITESNGSYVQSVPGIRPEENMTRHKLAKLLSTIEMYLEEREVGEWQVDLVTVYIDEDKKLAKCEFFENVSF
jgi:putative endonuclease